MLSRSHARRSVLVLVLLLGNLIVQLVIEPNDEQPTDSNRLAGSTPSHDSTRSPVATIPTATAEPCRRWCNSSWRGIEDQIVVVKRVNVHENDRISKSTACSVTWCKGVNHRKSISVLFDGSKDFSDADPPLSRSALTIAHAGLINKIDGILWPSLEIDDPQTVFPQEPSSLDYVRCTHRNAVIGFAVNYRAESLQPFVSSFQRYHGPCDEAILFVDDLRLPLVIDRDKGNVKFVSRKTWVHRTPGAWSMPTANQRVVTMANWLRDKWGKYHYVVSVDTRDVIFFGNIFAPLASLNVTGLFSVTETEDFASNSINQLWLARFAGSKILNDYIGSLHLHGRRMPVLCSGIYGGSALAVFDYVTAFARALGVASRAAKDTLGIDQGVHIYLQFFGLALAKFPHPILLLDESIGPIRHWYTQSSAVLRDKLGRHLNCDMQPYAIVHQLDRWQSLWADAFADYTIRSGVTKECVMEPLRLPPQFSPLDTVPSWAVRHQFGERAGAVSPEQPQVSCFKSNALLVFTSQFDSALLQATIAAFQRFHTTCDRMVIFVPDTNGDFPAIGVAEQTNVHWLVYSQRVNWIDSATRGRYVRHNRSFYAAALFMRWLRDHEGVIEQVCAIENLVDARVALFGNLFQPWYERNFSGVWFLPYVPLDSEEKRRLVASRVITEVAHDIDVEFCFRFSVPLSETIAGSVESHSTLSTIYGGRLPAVLAMLRLLLRNAESAPSVCSLKALQFFRDHLFLSYLKNPQASRFPHEVVTVDLGGLFTHAAGSQHLPFGRDQFGRPINCPHEWASRGPFRLIAGLSTISGSPGSLLFDDFVSAYRSRGKRDAFFETHVSGKECE